LVPIRPPRFQRCGATVIQPKSAPAEGRIRGRVGRKIFLVEAGASKHVELSILAFDQVIRTATEHIAKIEILQSVLIEISEGKNMNAQLRLTSSRTPP
jgi:hypothetical protein